MMAGRIVKDLFLSWCHADRTAKDALIQPLMDNLRILNGVEVRWWEDSHINIGEDWRRRILAGLNECDYGLLLLSPGFFASGFIAEHELPAFVGPRAVKGALPVGLKRVPLDGTRTLRGVDSHQIFYSRAHGPVLHRVPGRWS
jgi:TIR domain